MIPNGKYSMGNVQFQPTEIDGEVWVPVRTEQNGVSITTYQPWSEIVEERDDSVDTEQFRYDP